MLRPSMTPQESICVGFEELERVVELRRLAHEVEMHAVDRQAEGERRVVAQPGEIGRQHQLEAGAFEHVVGDLVRVALGRR